MFKKHLQPGNSFGGGTGVLAATEQCAGGIALFATDDP